MVLQFGPGELGGLSAASYLLLATLAGFFESFFGLSFPDAGGTWRFISSSGDG